MNSAIDRSSGVREMVIADGKNHLAAVRELIGEMVLDTILPLKAAISLYKKNGFHECEAYYRNPMSDVIYMRKEL